MSIVPETKDWTWVLERPCPECGLDTREIERSQIAGMLRSLAPAWAEVCERDPRELRTRPRPDRWAALEYACHVRDVLGVLDERVQLMLNEESPVFAFWDQDATAVADRYLEQSPSEVAEQIRAAAEVAANDYASVQPGQWERGVHAVTAPGSRS